MAQPDNQRQPDFPTAIVNNDTPVGRLFSRSTGWFWLLAAACLVVAAVLTVRATKSTGTMITVQFNDGHGLKAEDSLRYRGIDVGHVESVRLRDTNDGVDVVLNLYSDAESIACDGSQFWIERPQISLSRMSGLETVVGAKYVGVSPGPSGGTKLTEFVGLENPPRLQLAQTTDATISIQFDDGNGIAAGDVVKYRGIVIGEVTNVRLQPDLTGVIVEASLTKEARTVARKGTIFWVERAQVGLSGIRGLDTLVRGQYIALHPGPIGSVPMQAFVGAEEAPASFNPIEDGLAIKLISEERFGLERGAPITYRGLPAGQITSVELTDDALSVQVLGTISPKYHSLVRTNTQFWNKSGMDFHIGLRGVDMEMDPMSMLKATGIAFATPDPAGEPVESGTVFKLSAEESAGWMEWRPSFDGHRVESTVGRGQRLLNRIRSPFGGSEEPNDDQ